MILYINNLLIISILYSFCLLLFILLCDCCVTSAIQQYDNQSNICCQSCNAGVSGELRLSREKFSEKVIMPFQICVGGIFLFL